MGKPESTELGVFLRAMRARLQPEDVGLPRVGARRTPGLRRQEVAQLATVSIDWYIRLEQGRVGTPGIAVLDALAQALRLTPAEHQHLHMIAGGRAPGAAPEAPEQVSDSMRRLLDGMPLLPAYIVDFRLDILAWNAAAPALFGEDFGAPGDTGNMAGLLFLVPRIRRMQRDWERVAREKGGNLRASLGRHPDDPRLRRVVGELCRRSGEFAAWWDDYTVRERGHGTKRIVHDAVGELTVCYDALVAGGGTGHSLIAVTPADAAADRALRRLAATRTPPGLRSIVA
jgi:transcriptional regulator with XRE-family HTH domain